MAEANTDLANVLAAVPRLTAKELNTVSEAIEAARLEHSTTDRQALLAEFQEKAAALGLSLEELVKQPKATKAKSGKATKKVAPKYRASNGDEWSGRGRPPKWIVMLEAEGKRREDYLIK
jgi:DNA-binding protein H-NS